MKFYQACFGKPNNINWALFNVSEDIPAKLSSMYEKLENSNTPQNLNKDDMVNDDQSPLCMLEILAQDNAIGISRIMYGMADNMGRPTMFAHGFMFENAIEMLKDPNSILSISDANFKYDIEETKDIPNTLVYGDGYNITEALDFCNMSREAIIKLMACVYYSLRSATPMPIYLISKRHNEIIRPLAYCIYSLMPYTLRGNISISNANNFQRAQFKSLMFVNKQYPNTMYYNIDTNETNIDLADIKNHRENYPFLLAISKYEIVNYSVYCEQIQTQLDKMQLSASNDYNVLKIADTMLADNDRFSTMSDQELTRFILEFSGYAPMQNAYVDGFLADIIKEYNRRNLMPNEVFMKRLQVRAEKTSVKEFVDIYKTLHLKTLINGGINVIIDFLISQRNSSYERFSEWCKYINSIENGASYIESYYEKRIHLSRELSEITSLYKESAEFISFSKLYNIANTRCYDITREKLLQFDESNLSEILDEYSNTFTEINKSSGAAAKQANIDLLIGEYWRHFSFDKIEFTDAFITNLQCMESENNSVYKKAECLIELYRCIQESVGIYSTDSIVSEVERVLEKIESGVGFSPNEIETITPKIQRFIIDKLRRFDNSRLVFWVNVASFGRQYTNINPFENVMKWELSVFNDDECFDEYVDASRRIDDHAREYKRLIEAYMRSIDNKSENYKLLKRRAADFSYISDIVEKEEKKQRKAEEKMRKAEIREELDENENHSAQHEKKGFSIGGLFGGNFKRRK